MALATAAFFIAACAVTGERATTWRAGDPLVYTKGCHDAEAVRRIAQSGINADETHMVLAREGRCFYLPIPFPAVLVRWIEGPYSYPSTGTAGSIWEIRDGLLDTEFIWLDDVIGPRREKTEPPAALPRLEPPTAGAPADLEI